MTPKKVLLFIAVMAALCGCSKAVNTANPPGGQAPPLQQGPVTKAGVDGFGQHFLISTTGLVPKEALPPFSSMKLVDFDVIKYIERACGDGWKERRCDVYVQPDPKGTLLGYLTMEQYNDGLSFNTDTVTTSGDDSGRICIIGGKIEKEIISPGNIDPSKDFQGITTINTTDDQLFYLYFDKVGNRLEVSDDKWNYCYPTRHVDDVYILIGSLVRQLNPKNWPKSGVASAP